MIIDGQVGQAPETKRPPRWWATLTARILVAALIAWSPSARAEDFPILEKGDAAPFKGSLLPEAKVIELAQRLKGCEAEREALQQVPAPPPALVVGAAIVGVVVGAVAGGVVVFALKK